MFDLETEIGSWRASLEAELLGSSDRLAELESHLRDAFDRERQRGRDDRHAWDEAIRQLGDMRGIAREFRKANVTWLPASIGYVLLCLAVIAVTIGCARAMHAQRMTLLLASHIVAVTLGYLALLILGAMAFCAAIAHARSHWPTVPQHAFRVAGLRLGLLGIVASTCGIVLGMIWSHQNWGRWWGWDARELGAVAVLAWSVLMWINFRAAESSASRRLTAALIASVVVCIAWFGPFIGDVQTGIHSAPIGIAVIVLVLAHFGAIHVAQLPART